MPNSSPRPKKSAQQHSDSPPHLMQCLLLAFHLAFELYDSVRLDSRKNRISFYLHVAIKQREDAVRGTNGAP